MINKQDILDRAAEWQLRAEVVEKHYVLGWLLAAISLHPELQGLWIFKGGTCIKKTYFETYPLIVMKEPKRTRKVRTNKTNYMSDEAFANLKKALEDALAFESGKLRLHVTRIQAPRGRRNHDSR